METANSADKLLALLSVVNNKTANPLCVQLPLQNFNNNKIKFNKK